MMNRFLAVCFFISFSLSVQAQQITFSEPYREDAIDMNFDILGKINGTLAIFKNVRWHYAVNFFTDSMQLKKKVELDYLPGKTVNVDCIPYNDCIWLIYQYQKKGILYCMAQKLDAEGEKVNEPMQLDTTSIGSMGDNKIYSTIFSDDKKSIVVFKMQRKDDMANFVVKLYDKQLQLRHQSRLSMPYEDRIHSFGDFFVDNDGNFVFTNTERKNTRENPGILMLITKAPQADTFKVIRLPFDSAYVDEIKMKIDNLNKRYIVSSFYYTERTGNIEGMYNYVWDVTGDSVYASVFIAFNDELRAAAKSSGSNKTAFDEFLIRNIILKRDGSFIVTAEDQSTQSSGINNFNRYDYLYGSRYLTPYDYYSYSPSYYGYYRPFNSFGNTGTRYYNDNVLVLSVAKNGNPEWTNIIHKQQEGDDNDNYISFCTFNTSGEIHFLFNDISRRDKQISDNIITPGGTIKRSPTLRTYEKGFDLMPRFAKQVGARQIIIPCTYRGQICFAKVDF